MVHSGAKVEGDMTVGGEGFSYFGVIKGDYSAAGGVKREPIGVKGSVHL